LHYVGTEPNRLLQNKTGADNRGQDNEAGKVGKETRERQEIGKEDYADGETGLVLVVV
jgi:hypothetical protein